MIGILLFILRNIQRRPLHTTLTAITVAIAVAALFASLWLGRGLERGLEQGSKRLGADILVLPEDVDAKPEQMLFTGNPMNIYMDKKRFDDVKSMPGIKQATPQFFTKTASAMCCNLVSAGRVVGIDPETDFIVQPWLKAAADKQLESGKIIIGSNVEAELDDLLLIRGMVFRVIGRLDPTGTGVDDSSFININTARRLAGESPDLQSLWKKEGPQELISAILVQVKDQSKTYEIAQTIDKLPGANAFPASQVIHDTKQRMGTITYILYVLTAVLWLVSLTSLLGRFASLAIERKREIGILRALGALRWGVFRLILWEAGILALVSSVAGLGLGWLLSHYVTKWVTTGTTFPFLSLPVADMLNLVLLCLAAAIVSVVLAALFPAYHSASLDPARAIAQGELE